MTAKLKLQESLITNLVTVSNAQINIRKCQCPECDQEIYELDGIGLELESCPHCHYYQEDEMELLETIEMYILVDPVTGVLKAVTGEELDDEIKARL